MRYRLPLIIMLFCTGSAIADFSTASYKTHPIEPAMHLGPYLIEITGEWPTDCHPGEQKPVIREFTGDAALVEFETIIEHVTCNDVPTPYRVLIDMSDVIDGGVHNPTGIEVTIRFGGIEHTELVSLLCICSPAPVGPDIKPEPGLYEGAGLQKQGLLLARQNDRMGVYPLIYDESGNSQWLFGGGGIVEDVYFAKLKELSGGQCLGCPVPDEPPQIEVVGKLAMLMDSQGLIQVKVNDGLFVPYVQLEFGYGIFPFGPPWEGGFPDHSGRWAFAEVASNIPPGSPGESLIPLVFDVVFESNEIDLPMYPVVGTYPVGPVNYSLVGIDESEVAAMECWVMPLSDTTAEYVCYVSHPDVNGGETVFEARMLSHERLTFDYVAVTAPEVAVDPSVAVRVD